jgi:hypothetical protein
MTRSNDQGPAEPIRSWREFDRLAVKPWRFAKQVGRPFFVGECGCVEGDECGGGLPHGTAKQQWFLDALVYMRDTAPSFGLPPLKAFCYSTEGFFGVGTSRESIQGMKTLANDPFFSKRP